jgi:hypothetical protein
MKTVISVLVVLIGLLSFSKPMEAQSFQSTFVYCNVIYSGSPSVEYQYYQVYLRVTTTDGHHVDEVLAIDLIQPSELNNPHSFYGDLQVWVPALIHKGYYRIGVAVVGVDSGGGLHPLGTRASEWCDFSDLSSNMTIEL